MFEKIAGYEVVKEELIRIRDWFLNKDILNNENIRLPKGILFHGTPGNGKTLFIKEYANSFNVPIINIEGNNENTAKEIHDSFTKSKEYDLSIILIDEIDNLIGSNENNERALKAELDGVNSNKKVLVLATTNSIFKLSEPLLRSGRFDRVIAISRPDKESREELLRYYTEKLNINGDIDFEYLSRILYGVCGSDITAILNDVLLRCGNNVHTFDIETSYNRIVDNNLDDNQNYDPSKANPEIAYHEVAHAIMINKYKENHYFYKACFTEDYTQGLTKSLPLDDVYFDSNTIIQDLEISLAGYVVTKLISKRSDCGCISDLLKARGLAAQLINKLGTKGPDMVLPFYDHTERMETEIRRRKNEREIEKIIRKSVRRVKKYLKSHLIEIELLFNIMMKKGFIDNKDMDSVMSQNGSLHSNQLHLNLNNTKLIEQKNATC